MTIYQVDVALVASLQIGAHILPPDGKQKVDEGAEVFSFNPSLDGARALTPEEVSLLLRSRIQLMQKREKALHCPGIHANLMIASIELADLIGTLAPGRHQIIPLTDVWFDKDPVPASDQFAAVLIMDYAHTIDLERSKIRRTRVAHRGKDAVRLTAIYPKDRVVYPATAHGRHIWADNPTGAILCSDTFRTAVLALPGKSGLDFAACTEG